MNRFVLEVGHFDAVGAGQIEDLGGPGNARQVRPVADLAPVAGELSEKFLRPDDFVLRRDSSSFTTGHWSGERQILPVMPNSAETAVASISLSALEPMVGPSIALGRPAARAAMVKRDRA